MRYMRYGIIALAILAACSSQGTSSTGDASSNTLECA